MPQCPLAGLCQHVSVVLGGELSDGVGMGKHGLLLPVRASPVLPAVTWQALPRGHARDRDRIASFRRAGAVGITTYARGRWPDGALRRLDEPGLQGQAGQVGAAAAAGLVPDPV